MEIKIDTITNKTSKSGKEFWVVESGNDKYTVWDDGIAEELTKRLGQNVDVDIKTSGNFKNIRGIETGNIAVNPSQKIEAPVQAGLHSFKDMSIVSQVMLKCASEMYCTETAIDCSQGEYLANAINELTGAYKLALSNMKAI